jgi:uncharacterized SAM-binding protein YcdF (DUF218 family)
VFLFKKIVAPLLFPMPLCMLLLLGGLVLLWFTKRKRTGTIACTVGTLVLFALGYGSVSGRLLGPVEAACPPLAIEDTKDVRFIVVLSGAHVSDERLPVTAQLGRNSVVRVAEGVRLYRQIRGTTLVMMGGKPFDNVPAADLMADLARDLGVPKADIRVETASRDTKDQAAALREFVGDAPFVLVTSASHMRRAVAMLRKQGLKPLPAPTAHVVKGRTRISPHDFYPGSGGLGAAERAWNEHLGYAWAWLRGQV